MLLAVKGFASVARGGMAVAEDMWRVACGAGTVKADAVAKRETKNAAWVISLPALEQMPFAVFQATAGSITATGKEAHSLVNIWPQTQRRTPSCVQLGHQQHHQQPFAALYYTI